MKIRMLVTMTGTRNGAEWPPKGGEIDLPDGEAKDLCRGGLAEQVSAASTEPDEERAVAPAPETRRGRGRPSKE
jgi:hypothetical protein